MLPPNSVALRRFDLWKDQTQERTGRLRELTDHLPLESELALIRLVRDKELPAVPSPLDLAQGKEQLAAPSSLAQLWPWQELHYYSTSIVLSTTRLEIRPQVELLNEILDHGVSRK